MHLDLPVPDHHDGCMKNRKISAAVLASLGLTGACDGIGTQSHVCLSMVPDSGGDDTGGEDDTGESDGEAAHTDRKQAIRALIERGVLPTDVAERLEPEQ